MNWNLLLSLCVILVFYTLWSMWKVFNMVDQEEGFLNYKDDIHGKLPKFIQGRINPDTFQNTVLDNPLVKYNPYVYLGKKTINALKRILPDIPKPKKVSNGELPPLPNIPPPPDWMTKKN